MKCLRSYFEEDDNEAIVKAKKVPRVIAEKCSSYTNDREKYNCIRRAVAGVELAQVMRSVGNERNPISVDTPDSRVVTQTIILHPRSQCRLDTYFHAALCDKDITHDVSSSEASLSVCHENNGESVGVRPVC